MRSLVIIAALLILLPVSAFSQSGCPTMPPGFLCITQAAGNRAAELAREAAAKDAKIVVLEDSLKQKDVSIAEIKATAATNEAALKEAIHKTEIELATKTGQLIASEAEKTRQIAIIDVLLKGQKKKCLPLSVCIF